MRMRTTLAWGAAVAACLGSSCYAQGTKLWTVTRYEEMERGTTNGVAIRSDGALEPGPAVSSVYQTGGNLVWSVAPGAGGTAFLGLGGTAGGSAIVMHVGADGKATKVLEARELGVQALRAGTNGAMYAATSPDGKVYKLGTAPADAQVVFDAAQTAEKPKYIWDVVESGSDLFVATGAPAIVYRVPAAGGAPQIAFRTADQHIRCLLLAPDGNLWAGSDGSGVIYRFDTKSAAAKPFAVYAATRREITSLAIDASGNVYAAGVGQGSGPSLPPLPITGSGTVNVTVSQPGSTSAANTNTLVPDGSEIYRIAPDGTPSKLATLKDDVVYALAMHKGNLLAATGNRGRVYRVDTTAAGRVTDLAHLESAQGMAIAETPTGVFVATSNSGRLYRLDDKPAADPTYTSEVFDAHVFSKWGRVEVLPENSTGADLYVRTGNVENPLMGWSDWVQARSSATVPGGRYAQWKAVLHSDTRVASVAVNYLEKNLAPVVDDVVVQPGARMQPSTPSTSTTVQVSFPTAASSSSSMNLSDGAQPPLIAQRDRSAVTARWRAHDDNGDDLMYAVWYRGIGEKNWRLLKDDISDKYLSFDASQLPDGRYEVRVVASDAPQHTDADTLDGERVSAAFLVDTTPPVPGPLTAALVPGPPTKIHATFSAKDATSPIASAEYSVDAGPWQYLEPVGKLSDSLEERYDFTADVPAPSSPTADPREHVLAVRVYDRADNVVSAKAVVH